MLHSAFCDAHQLQVSLLFYKMYRGVELKPLNNVVRALS